MTRLLIAALTLALAACNNDEGSGGGASGTGALAGTSAAGINAAGINAALFRCPITSSIVSIPQ